MSDLDDVVICEPLRTPVGRFGGALSGLSAVDLGVTTLTAILERTGIDPGVIDDIVIGHSFPTSEAPAIGRVIGLDSGLPVEVPGVQIDRRCGSGLQAVIFAAMMVPSTPHQVVIAGGVESMSNAVHYSTTLRTGTRFGDSVMHDSLVRGRITAGGTSHPVPGGMIETAETLRRMYGVSRDEQDKLALRSHERAVSAAAAGHFKQEIVPVVTIRGKERIVVATDEHPRADASLAALGALRPVMADDDADATVTAGNASGQNDAAAMAVVTTRSKAAQLGLRPMVRIASWAVAGVGPEIMGIGPVPASKAALEMCGLTLADMDLIELNEAFAAQVLACAREWHFDASDFERLNVNGSGISLGHPVGATGARILATLAYELERRGGRYALETMCIGGGQGIAAVFEYCGG